MTSFGESAAPGCCLLYRKADIFLWNDRLFVRIIQIKWQAILFRIFVPSAHIWTKPSRALFTQALFWNSVAPSFLGGIMEKPYWEDKEYSYFSHKKCEYFPCHKGADPENFNCLFCYCPLYALGDRCGGNFRYTEKGIKDCTNCQLPHKKQNYGYITGKYRELAELMSRNREKE